ncbi:MAG: DNA primase [Alteromonadaceae bacterium]|nr:DNA primase [Alteromonadaceae bacterium]|tara:strand:- start:791 stop:2452 length:1662 start_codon:yes stop_codon:yes gene_type:complete
MSGMIPQRFIDDLLERIDLVELVGSRVTLKKAGRNYKACCPFHEERTPSFNVRPDKGFYHCFGCGAHGDAISFLRESDHLGFTEAVEELAKRAGLEVPYDQAAREEIRQVRTLTQALETATDFYCNALQQHPGSALAREYIRNRGLNQDIVERYRVGFAPPEGDALARNVDAETRKTLLETHTLSDRYGSVRDLFRNRIMFPIRNSRGRTIGFGGRTLGDDKAKYINSPESDAFHKSREIYGLYEAMQARRQIDKLLVVEGYMDVIALAQHGIDYAVATLGTATNSESLGALLKQARHLVFCFDGDTAGHRAADKALDNALEMLADGMHLQFLILPPGEDPDSLVRKEGAEAFRKRIDEAAPLSRYLFERQSEGLDLTLPEHQGELRARVEPLIRRMPRSTLSQGMWQEMIRLCSRPAFRSRGFPREFGKKGPPIIQGPPLKAGPRKEKTLCLALFYNPALAAQAHPHLAKENDLGVSAAFAEWLLEREIMTQDEVMARLATDTAARQRFYNMFDGIEHFLDEESVCREALDSLETIKETQAKRLIARPGRLH